MLRVHHANEKNVLRRWYKCTKTLAHCPNTDQHLSHHLMITVDGVALQDASGWIACITNHRLLLSVRDRYQHKHDHTFTHTFTNSRVSFSQVPAQIRGAKHTVDGATARHTGVHPTGNYFLLFNHFPYGWIGFSAHFIQQYHPAVELMFPSFYRLFLLLPCALDLHPVPCGAL